MMELFVMEKRVLNTAGCGSYPCYQCTKKDECGWCGDSSQGVCQAKDSACKVTVITDKAHCSSVAASQVLRNVTGLMGAMLALIVMLNVINRCQNRRRSKKLEQSIFTLPCYVYPSREKRAEAMREARGRLRAPLDVARDIDLEEQASDGEASDDSNMVSPSCTICLSVYENEEVIKVLPCGHDFHAECLDPWLQLKATCPLCKTQPFIKAKERSRRGHSHGNGQSQAHVAAESGQPATQASVHPRRGQALLREPPFVAGPRDMVDGGVARVGVVNGGVNLGVGLILPEGTEECAGGRGEERNEILMDGGKAAGVIGEDGITVTAQQQQQEDDNDEEDGLGSEELAGGAEGVVECDNVDDSIQKKPGHDTEVKIRDAGNDDVAVAVRTAAAAAAAVDEPEVSVGNATGPAREMTRIVGDDRQLGHAGLRNTMEGSDNGDAAGRFVKVAKQEGKLGRVGVGAPFQTSTPR